MYSKSGRDETALTGFGWVAIKGLAREELVVSLEEQVFRKHFVGTKLKTQPPQAVGFMSELVSEKLTQNHDANVIETFAAPIEFFHFGLG